MIEDFFIIVRLHTHLNDQKYISSVRPVRLTNVRSFETVKMPEKRILSE